MFYMHSISSFLDMVRTSVPVSFSIKRYYFYPSASYEILTVSSIIGMKQNFRYKNKSSSVDKVIDTSRIKQNLNHYFGHHIRLSLHYYVLSFISSRCIISSFFSKATSLSTYLDGCSLLQTKKPLFLPFYWAIF